MARALRKVKVTPGGEVDRLLEAASNEPLLLERAGELYLLNRAAAEDVWADYDPEKVRESIATYAGSWKDLDLETLKASLYRARDEGTKPPPRV